MSIIPGHNRDMGYPIKPELSGTINDNATVYIAEPNYLYGIFDVGDSSIQTIPLHHECLWLKSTVDAIIIIGQKKDNITATRTPVAGSKAMWLTGGQDYYINPYITFPPLDLTDQYYQPYLQAGLPPLPKEADRMIISIINYTSGEEGKLWITGLK
jgi:hypothetical protein